MWLIDSVSFLLKEFNESQLPPYAVLSHTWGKEEVSFAELRARDLVGGVGWEKVRETCRLARNEGFQYAWIDTCCIDKSSSAELTESINSMFRWYQKSEVCYVYLEDLQPGVPFDVGIARSKWITRGWTLQEVIAPKRVVFFDREWMPRGDKREKGKDISKATGIPEEVLSMKRAVSGYSVAQRMSWAARRQTTRIEDTAYCLLGLFQVSLPLIYGEGEMAFYRLQEEIIKRDNDMTLFAWNPTEHQPTNGEHCSMLAVSPAAFRDSGNVHRWPLSRYNPDFALTNKGLRTHGYLALGSGIDRNEPRPARLGYSMRIARIPDGPSSRKERWLAVAISLWKAGPDLYLRRKRDMLINSDNMNGLEDTLQSTVYVVIKMKPPGLDVLAPIRQGAVRFVIPGSIIRRPSPETRWDYTDLLFFKQVAGVQDVNLTMIRIRVGERDHDFVVVLGLGWNFHSIFIYLADRYPRETRDMFQFQDAQASMQLPEFMHRYPALNDLEDRVKLTVDGVDYVVKTSCVPDMHRVFQHKVDTQVLEVKVEKRGEAKRGRRRSSVSARRVTPQPEEPYEPMQSLH